MSAGGSAGVPRHARRVNKRFMRHSAKKRVERAEIALGRYRVKAAAILRAEGLHGPVEEPHSSYVFKILRHRETGVRVRVLDTQAADAPWVEGADVVHQYVVECQTHGARGRSFAAARPAVAAARHPEQWCLQCAHLPGLARPRRASR